MTHPSLIAPVEDRPDQQAFSEGVRDTLAVLTGQLPRSTKLAPLKPGASLPEVIEALNHVIARLNG
jgi:hypothetical protein